MIIWVLLQKQNNNKGRWDLAVRRRAGAHSSTAHRLKQDVQFHTIVSLETAQRERNVWLSPSKQQQQNKQPPRQEAHS